MLLIEWYCSNIGGQFSSAEKTKTSFLMKRKLDFDMQTRPLDVQIKFRLPIRQNFDNFFTQLDENRILSTQ